MSEAIDIAVIHDKRFRQKGEQPVKEGNVRVGLQLQVQIGDGAGRCLARVHYDHPQRRVCSLGRFETLEQDRMTPGEIGADQHNKVCQFKIFIGSRNRVRAECPPVPGNRRCHAKAGIGVDIRRTDEPFHQFVGDVIVFGQDLAGHIKRNAIWSMFPNGILKVARDKIERVIPVGAFAVDFRIEQSVIQRKRFSKGRTLGTKPAEI